MATATPRGKEGARGVAVAIARANAESQYCVRRQTHLATFARSGRALAKWHSYPSELAFQCMRRWQKAEGSLHS